MSLESRINAFVAAVGADVKALLSRIPTGGSTGQLLRKKSGTDFDTEWATVSASGDTRGIQNVGATNATVVLANTKIVRVANSSTNITITIDLTGASDGQALTVHRDVSLSSTGSISIQVSGGTIQNRSTGATASSFSLATTGGQRQGTWYKDGTVMWLLSE